MLSRSVYRKWFNSSDNTENYLLIHPSGLMLQISFSDDEHGQKVEVYQTSPKNRLNPDVFVKNKEKCTKGEWEKARKKVIELVKGDTMNLMLSKNKSV